ncbi:MAG: hypothetical protein H6592_13205 [Flavobacteriales bacterium]|nr:hypothetical protein [Flavobacteriales bacterium]HPF90340.1 hypothetical protein [Flavobacteriales bacterium]
MKRTMTLVAVCGIFQAAGAQSGCVDRYLTDALTYTNIVTSSDQVSQPRDLDFKPYTNELWVMNRGGSNGGSMVIVRNAGMPDQVSEYRKDSHSGHFMVQACAMAFSDNGEWAAVSEVQNTASASSTFMGPALWSGDPGNFATVFQNNWVTGYPLGSHLDMLHQSPYAMGIASDSLKVYWVMDGHNGNICRYDFVADHGSGYDDHSAGKIWRYTDVTVSRVPNIPSHMVLDRVDHWLYYIDGGTKQIKRLNTMSGDVTGNLSVPSTSNEPLSSYKKVENATVEIVDTWTEGQPCGMDYVDGRLIVSDNTTGDIRIYDVTGTPALLGTVATGQAGIMGVKVGPDGRIWFAHYTGNKVVRIDPVDMTDDAAIRAITAPATIASRPDFYSTAFDLCSASIVPEVELANAGNNDLTSVDILYAVDGGPAVPFSWSGMLAPGSTTNVTLPSSSIDPGSHELAVWTTMPNGTLDMGPLNNEIRGAFRSLSPAQGLPFNEGFEGTQFPPQDWQYVHFNPNLFMQRVTNASGMGWSSACLKMDNYSGEMNVTGQKDHMMLPTLDLSSAPVGTELAFHVAYRQYNSSSTDALRVKASTDCGSTWNTLYSKQGNTLSTGTPLTSAFTPAATQWRAEQVDLATVLGESEVILLFEAESNWGNNLYIDDVQVGMAVGIAERTGAELALFPNPSAGHVRIRTAGLGGQLAAELLTTTGERARNFVLTGAEDVLDLGGLASGTYLLTVRGAHQVITRPIILLQE